MLRQKLKEQRAHLDELDKHMLVTTPTSHHRGYRPIAGNVRLEACADLSSNWCSEDMTRDQGGEHN